MDNAFKRYVLLSGAAMFLTAAFSQTYVWISSTEGNNWKESRTRLQISSTHFPVLEVKGNEEGIGFNGWGTCFNELGYDALNVLAKNEQETIMKNIFSPTGDLRFTIGRIPMNANDYARNWYSCDEVAGDFKLQYFNIDRDKQALIPFIRFAQQYNPGMTFWISPWGPPGWMKINNYYSVQSGEHNQMSAKSNIALHEGNTKKDEGVFPPILAANDYFIQDPRYLQSYALYFSKFIDAYKEQGIPITKAMYQNEPYSYTAYPGCAWTPEGTIRFNAGYLAPTLKKNHPGVEVYLGTINTNRFDEIDKILSDPGMQESIKGVGFQWEGGQILPEIREKYPQYKYMQTESECGWGSFDWKGAEHTFGLINHYLGNGCDEYIFWNVILADDGTSTWGWKQNALVRVDSKSRAYTLTPEYYAVKHYTNFIAPGSRVVAFEPLSQNKMPVLVLKTPQGKYVVIAGNFNNEAKEVTIRLEDRYLNVRLQARSFNSFVEAR
ncbi:MAG: hypothetical protein QM786_14395 [Breznakibacter sp.]